MRILSGDDVRRSITMESAIQAMIAAFGELAADQATLPLRSRIELPDQAAVSLFMPAYLAQSGVLGTKVVSVFPHNPTRHQQPSIYALIALFDPQTGKPLAVLDGTYLTALRTGAVSGAATHYLARPDARVLTVFGAGVQARTQVQAVCAVRDIAEVRVVNRTPQRAAQLLDLLRADGITAQVQIAADAAIALAGADVVCCATGATTPLFAAAEVSAGTHINAIGTHAPQHAEVPAATVAQAQVFVDDWDAALAEAGDILCARAAGLIDIRHIRGTLGDLVLGNVQGRTSPTDITFFKSVGIAIQDLAVAGAVLAYAREHEIGVEVPL